MTKRAVLLILVLVLCVGAAACEQAKPSQGSTTVLIVRHAEKASQEADPPLTDAGRQRAAALAEIGADAGVDAVFCSQYVRAKDTVAPLAQRIGVQVTEVPVDLSNPGDYGKRLADEILANHAGHTVVVVSHSNTVPSIVEALTGKSGTPMGDTEYDRLSIVTIPPGGGGHLIVARYGAPSS